MSTASDALYYPQRPRLNRGFAIVRSFARFGRTQPLAFVSLLVFAVVVVAAVLAPWIAPYDPLQPAPVDRLQGPSGAHWFGTDGLGRDVFSRVIYGSRVSMIVGIVTVAVGVGAGIVIGISSAYVGGMFDAVVQRILDSVMSIPGLILAIAISGVLGAGTLNSIVPIAILIIPINARVVRSSVLSIKERQFIEAATVIGASDGRIMVRHVFPNTLAPVFVLASIWLGNAIIIEASLSFLGLGTPPPNPSWGNMLSGDGRAFFERAPWLAIFPGLAITVVVLAMNLLGDGLRDALDPRLRGER